MRRNGNYRVIDARELGDLVIWCTQRPSLEELEVRLRNAQFIDILNSATGVKCFAGPIECQHEVNLQLETVSLKDLPIIYRMYLEPKSTNYAFIYISSNTIELHVPEIFFITGDRLRDESRFVSGVQLTDRLALALGITWDHIEYAGSEMSTILNDNVWRLFIASLFSRVELEDI